MTMHWSPPAAPLLRIAVDMAGLAWMDRARCAETDAEEFFPELGQDARRARRICFGCEVRAECLEYSLEHDEQFGVWGGVSERERRVLRRKRKAAA